MLGIKISIQIKKKQNLCITNLVSLNFFLIEKCLKLKLSNISGLFGK